MGLFFPSEILDREGTHHVAKAPRGKSAAYGAWPILSTAEPRAAML
jgi:hypothetical protein